MKVLIIGASGLVGGNILDCFREDANYEVLGTYRSFPVEGYQFFDPFDSESLDVVEKFRPQVIIHTGGWTYVDGCELDPKKSYRENVEATKIVIDLAKRVKAKLIYTSTDYVFDGEKGPYREEDEVNPINVYGKHKLLSENLIRSEISDYLIIRITNVYGNERRNKNFVSRTINDLKSNIEATITAPSDQYATPINAWDIARSLKLLIQNQNKGIYHISSTDYLSRIQLINAITRYFPDNKVVIKARKTGEMASLAPRPLFGGLLASKFHQEYPDFSFSNLEIYLRSILK